jgi:uncharacterized membrane protein
MLNSIEAYIEDLRGALAGSDPALVQDALSDAEEHLRTALDQVRRDEPELAEAEALARIINEYGSPGEIAEAYRNHETRSVLPLAPVPKVEDKSLAARFFGVFVDPRAYAALFYMLFSLITGVIYFTWAVTGLSLSVGFAILIFGLPFFAVFLLSIRGIALVEGRIVEALLGIRMPRRPRSTAKHLGLVDRFKALVTDRRSWTPILYMLLMMPLGTIYFSVFVTLISFGLSGVAYPILAFYFDLPLFNSNFFVFYPPDWLLPLIVMVGVLWVILTMHLAKAIGRLHGRFAKALLVSE